MSQDNASQAEFRSQVAAWMQDNRPADPGFLLPQTFMEVGSEQVLDFLREWQHKVWSAGYLGMAWPKEYGGQGMSRDFQRIADEEMKRLQVPICFNVIGLGWAGPLILDNGSDYEKEKYLKGILNAEDIWCQGFSEPNHGSDLGSIQTRAERDGDHYVVNGSKIWTSFAQAADWIFCLVRTDNSGRKQDGISFLLIDMTTPGVTVSPIETIDGIYHLNEVHFDNARVPLENRIGEEGKGWTYAKSLLVHERLSIAEVADSKLNLEQLRELARAEVNGGESLLQDPVFAKRLADVEIDLMALEFTELRVLASAAEGGMPGPESSLLKLQGTTIQQSIQELRMDVAGYYSQTLQGDLSATQFGNDFADFAQKQYFRGRASSIYGGSDEVQKNVTAKHVLGL